MALTRQSFSLPVLGLIGDLGALGKRVYIGSSAEGLWVSLNQREFIDRELPTSASAADAIHDYRAPDRRGCHWHAKPTQDFSGVQLVSMSLSRTCRSTVCACLAFGLLLTPAIAAEAPPDVRALMTADEFNAAGLERLSPAELEALNRWLLRYTAQQASELGQHSELVKEEVRKVEVEGVRTRIEGEFFGWDGDTVFRLENGQVWKQRLPGRWSYRASSPEVELSKNFLGYWMLRVLEADRSVGVTRVN